LQVHYDNPAGLTGVVDDTSAVLLHFTDTPREHEAGTINIGDPQTVLAGQRVESGVNYTFTCPSACTSQLAEPLTIYDSRLHAHRTALYLFTNQYRNGTFLRTLEGARFWSNDHQRQTMFAPAELLPGDELEITGTYDASKLDAARAAGAPDAEPPLVWGLATPDEMLISFIFVYPRPRRAGAPRNDTINYCGLVLAGADGQRLTGCSNGHSFVAGTSLLPMDPLSANGRGAGWAPAFGGPPQCAVAAKGGAAPPPPTAPPAPTLPPTPTVGGDGDDESECFPASATVTVAGRGAVRMDAVRRGDAVLAGDGTYSRVYLWSHADAAAEATFVTLTTVADGDGAVVAPPAAVVGANGTTGAACAAATGGAHTLTVSAGHLLPVHGAAAPVAASAVAVGDALVGPTGAPRRVTAVASAVGRGLYHPHTIAGTLVIDGAVVATDRTAGVPPGVAAVGLAAARAAAAVGLGGVLSTALGGGCPGAIRPLLRAVGAVRV